MTRKTVLAVLLAILFSAGSVSAAEKTPPSPNNLGKLTRAEAEAASSEPVIQEETSSTATSQLPQLALTDTSGASDSLASFGPSSGTVVGNRALELRDEVLRLRSSVNLNGGEFTLLRANGAAGAVQYHSTVAAITARLQNGTTRGNPILLRQWEEAEASLNEVNNSLDRLNALQTSVAADASLASYLLESVQAAFQLSGAVDEDHDQLKLLRDEVSRMVVQLEYMRNQVADDIQRQTTYLTTERMNLQALAFAVTRGELMGSSLANKPVIVPPQPSAPAQQSSSLMPSPSASPAIPVTPAQVGPAPMSPRDYMQDMGSSETMTSNATSRSGSSIDGRLLVLIRYNQPVVEYEQQLSRAIGSVLERQPSASFSVIAVSPASGEPAELATAQEAANRNAEGVKRSLVQLGLAPSRITVASAQLPSAQTPEVHVYVR